MIDIYGTPTCTWCVKAKKLADSHGLKYTYKEITSSNTSVLAELRSRFSGVTTVPQIFWDHVHIGGYDDFESEISKRSGIIKR